MPIPSVKQIAKIITKALEPFPFSYLVSKLEVNNVHSSTCGVLRKWAIIQLCQLRHLSLCQLSLFSFCDYQSLIICLGLLYKSFNFPVIIHSIIHKYYFHKLFQYSFQVTADITKVKATNPSPSSFFFCFIGKLPRHPLNALRTNQPYKLSMQYYPHLIKLLIYNSSRVHISPLQSLLK